MDNPTKPFEGMQLPLQGPRRQRPADDPLPADFVPLKLVLLPSKLTVEFTRPEMLIGRHSSADLRLTLPDVSRRHCRFVFQEGGWQVFDLASLNGIFVNGVKLSQAILHDRDVIDIGGFHFVIEIGASAGNSDREMTEGVIQSIAEALPRPILEFGEQQRKAS